MSEQYSGPFTRYRQNSGSSETNEGVLSAGSTPATSPSVASRNEYFFHQSSSLFDPASPSSVRTKSSVPPRPRRRVTKLSPANIRGKTCWICYESDQDPASNEKGHFVHACKCSLFAHENCLLKWIRQAQSSPGGNSENKQIRCPQCQQPFQVIEVRSPWLKLLQKLEHFWTRVALRFSIGSIGLGVCTVSGVYGYLAARAFLGKQLSIIIFATRWHWLYYVNLPSILPYIIVSHTGLLDALLAVIPLSLLSLPAPLGMRSLRESIFYPGTTVLSPSATVVLFPWLRLFYRRIRDYTFKKLLRSRFSVDATGSSLPPIVEVDVQANRDDRQLERPEPDLNVVEVEANANDALNAAFTYSFSLNQLSKIFVGALFFPFVSVAAGDALLKLAEVTESSFLRQVLGLQADTVYKFALSNSRLSSFNQAEPSLSWLRRVSGPIGLTTANGGLLDPIWWRTTVGGCLLLVVIDLFKLSKIYLEIKQRVSRRIKETDISRKLDLDIIDAHKWRTGRA